MEQELHEMKEQALKFIMEELADYDSEPIIDRHDMEVIEELEQHQDLLDPPEGNALNEDIIRLYEYYRQVIEDRKKERVK